MNTCAECRFWERDPGNADDAMNECNRFRLPDAKFDSDGIFLTRSDFGCVQFEPSELRARITPEKEAAFLDFERKNLT